MMMTLPYLKLHRERLKELKPSKVTAKYITGESATTASTVNQVQQGNQGKNTTCGNQPQ